MSTFMLQVVSHTPAWVWVLFVALLVLGYLQSKPRTVSATRLFALPVAMLGFSLYGIWSALGLDAVACIAWVAAVLLAMAANSRLRRPAGVSYSAADRRYLMPGSWFPLGLMMAIFCTRYAVSASLAIVPSLREVPLFAGAVGLMYGLLSGILLARARHAASSGKQL
ncbi:MAG: tat pathway signal sequence [Proteobacteria bacterium]|nr:tat pathway signal sequence [Pseudomonadota bacterium]